jgi:hypothetical protein
MVNFAHGAVVRHPSTVGSPPLVFPNPNSLAKPNPNSLAKQVDLHYLSGQRI